jgi:hypothetical protein
MEYWGHDGYVMKQDDTLRYRSAKGSMILQDGLIGA